MATTTSDSGDQRAVLTLSIEGARFSDMGMGRVGEIFGLLAKIAGEDSVLVRYSGGEIIIKEGRPLAGEDGHVFPNKNRRRPRNLAIGGTNDVLAIGSINKCLSTMGYAGRMTSHGARHTAKTLLSEHGWPRDWSEMQLAHSLPGLEAIYNQANWVRQRRVMMQWYADYIDALEAGISEEEIERFDAQVLLPGGQRFTGPEPV